MNMLPDERVYYAQNREDLILESFFGDTKTGFYVDVGACHPDVASVTKRFYLKGWHGINIEPQANLHGLFERDRKRDINLNIGISDSDTTLVLRTYVNNQGLSTIASEVKKEHESVEGNKTEAYEDIPIKVTTLSKIFKQYKVESIQFLKVDVEGYEYEVLNGNDWAKFRPEVICIEANHIVKDWRHILENNSYEKVFFDGLNEYYADSSTNIKDKFDYVGHVVLGLKGGISADDLEKIEELQASPNEKSGETISIRKSLGRTTRLTGSRISNTFKKIKAHK
jgi:FkbM family methyltransferase